MRGRDSISGRFAPVRREARASTTGTAVRDDATPVSDPPAASERAAGQSANADLRYESSAKASAGSRKSKCACGRRGNLHKASHAERRAAAVEQILIARKRPDRKEFPVAVVAQIKHARKTRRREALFIP